jgi:hypothetical protein
MATKKTRRRHDDPIVVELKRIFEEMRAQGARQDSRMDALTSEVRTQGARLETLTSEVRAQGGEMRAVRDLLVDAVARDHRRIDTIDRLAALEAGKH